VHASVLCEYKRERLVRDSGPKFVTPPLDRQIDITVLYRIAIFPHLHLFPSLLVLALYVAVHFLVQLTKKKSSYVPRFVLNSCSERANPVSFTVVSCCSLSPVHFSRMTEQQCSARNVTSVLDIMQLAVGEL
jgi:hypothetical protein